MTGLDMTTITEPLITEREAAHSEGKRHIVTAVATRGLWPRLPKARPGSAVSAE
jgi:hypothetical protein